MDTLRGLLLLARFRAAGFDLIPATPQGLLNSMAPLAAFTLVGMLGALVLGAMRLLLLQLFGNVVVMVAPAVIIHALARLFGREAGWLRTAVAFNWYNLALGSLIMATLMATLMAEGTA